MAASLGSWGADNSDGFADDVAEMLIEMHLRAAPVPQIVRVRPAGRWPSSPGPSPPVRGSRIRSRSLPGSDTPFPRR